MGGARALIASLGASISLVAGAALSLLFVSFLFAYDGLGGGTEEPTTHAALVVDGGSAVSPRRVGGAAGEAAAVVIRTPTVPAARARDAVQRPKSADIARESSAGVQTRPAPTRSDIPGLGDAGSSTSNSGATGPATGDGVRDLGESVGTTVGETGDAAGEATAPLGPPVSQAVQDVLNVVQELLKGATDGLAGTLDTALPRR